MHDLISVLDELRSYDNRISELSLKINEVPLTKEIEEKQRNILHSLDELDQLNGNIRLLISNIFKKGDVEKDEEAIGKLEEILLRIKNDNI